MIFLIATVFIAELIIICNIVQFIIKTDKAVCGLTAQVEKRRMILKWRMNALREIAEGFNEICPKLLVKFKKTKRNILVRAANELAQSIILLFFKPKYKKILLGTKTGIGMAKKLLRV